MYISGPSSAEILQESVKQDLTKLKFMHSTEMSLFGIPGCRVSRCGYTGEDGFEVNLVCSTITRFTEQLYSGTDLERILLVAT